jgi:hypothetical protein
MKIRPVGAEPFHAARQTDRHEELLVAFRNFWERAYKRNTASHYKMAVTSDTKYQ